MMRIQVAPQGDTLLAHRRPGGTDRWVIAALLLALALLALPLTSFSATQEAEEIAQLMRTNELDKALSRTELALQQQPSDAQLRFLKGMILVSQKRRTEAIEVFTQLANEAPDQAEPYNNLAALYAEGGDLDQARVALETALRKKPDFALAQENIGDLYAKLASLTYDQLLSVQKEHAAAHSNLETLVTIVGSVNRTLQTKAEEIRLAGGDASALERLGHHYATLALFSYEKAERLAPETATLQHKRDALRQVAANYVESAPVIASAPASQADATAPAAEASAATVTAEPASTDTKTVPLDNATASAPEREPLAEQPAATPLVIPPTPEALLAANAKTPDAQTWLLPPTSSSVQVLRREVLETVEQWAKAWSMRDTDRYLSFYSTAFKVPDGKSRQEWENFRLARIKNKSYIEVSVQAPHVTMAGNVVRVKFRQHYVSNDFKEDIMKTLTLAKQGDKWQILQENTQ